MRLYLWSKNRKSSIGSLLLFYLGSSSFFKDSVDTIHVCVTVLKGLMIHIVNMKPPLSSSNARLPDRIFLGRNAPGLPSYGLDFVWESGSHRKD